MMNSDLENYLNNLIEQRKRASSPEYQAKQAQLSEAQYNTDTNPQFIASLGKSLSQLGTLQDKVPGTGGLQDYADSMQQANDQRRQRDMDAENQRDANTGISVKAMQYLDERRRKTQEDAANRELMSKKFESQLSRDKDSQDYRNSMLGLKKQELEQKGVNEKAKNELATQKASQVGKKGENEANYRYVNLKNNADKLKELVKRYGTMELMGEHSAKMDALIYDMAIDYSKLVDPESVAREGEVKAAQKYLLPFRNGMMNQMFTKNDTAIKIIDEYKKSLDQRLEARKQGMLGNLDYKNPDIGSNPSTPTGKVRVVRPDGQKGSIPAEELEKALLQGYKRIE